MRRWSTYVRFQVSCVSANSWGLSQGVLVEVMVGPEKQKRLFKQSSIWTPHHREAAFRRDAFRRDASHDFFIFSKSNVAQ